MGIEAIGSAVGRAVSVAPAVGRGAGFGPSLGRIGGIPAPRMEGFSMSRITNPFLGIPKAPTYIENRGPSFLEPNIGFIRNPEAKASPQTVSATDTELPSGTEAVKIAEQWLGISSQPQKNHYVLGREHNEGSQQIIIEPVARPMDFRWKQPEVLPFIYPKPVVKQENDTKIQPNVRQIEFTKTAPLGAGFTQLDTRSAQENTVGQNFEEEILIKEKVDRKPEISEREEVRGDEKVLKIKAVEAVKISKARKEKIVIALRHVVSAGISIKEAGRYIRRFISASFWQDKSPLAGSKEDGTINLTLDALDANKNQYNSLEQAEEAYTKPVEKFIPLEVGEGVRVGTWGEVKQVIRGEVEVSHQNKYAVVVETRVKKSVQKEVTKGSQTETMTLEPEVSEPRIEDNADFAELFLRKAA